jgi:hypothetical protein
VTASEADVPDDKLTDYIVSWPGKWPKGARGSAAPSNGKERARGRVKPVDVKVRASGSVKGK